jgi:arabinose-5-phosphate isomerase
MATMSVRGFTQDDFARNHPSGRLGKRLTLRVRDLMYGGSRNPIVEPTATWSEVIGALCRRSLGAVNVVNPDGGLGGLVTDGDVRRIVQRTHPSDLVHLTAARMMTPNPTTVGPDVLAYEALRMMEDRSSQISVLPVVEPENGACLGLLRLHDILQRGLV